MAFVVNRTVRIWLHSMAFLAERVSKGWAGLCKYVIIVTRDLPTPLHHRIRPDSRRTSSYHGSIGRSEVEIEVFIGSYLPLSRSLCNGSCSRHVCYATHLVQYTAYVQVYTYHSYMSITS